MKLDNQLLQPLSVLIICCSSNRWFILTGVLCDFLKGLEPVLDDCKSCLAHIQQVADGILQQTGVAGQQAVRQQLNALRNRTNESCQLASQLKDELESHVSVWDDVDASHDSLLKWVKTMEAQLQNVELKSSLEQKREQLNQLKVMLLKTAEKSVNHLV